MDARRRMNPEAVADAVMQHRELVAGLSGDFDLKIKELNEARELLKAEREIDTTLVQAQKTRDEADRYSAAKKTDSDMLKLKLDAAILAAAEDKKILDKLVEEAKVEKASTASGWVKMEREKAARDLLWAGRMRELEERTTAVQGREDSIGASELRLRETQARLEGRLKKLAEVE